MSCLFAVTTDFPHASALRTQAAAGSRPPISSTITSASDARTTSKLSVQATRDGSHETRRLSTLRVHTWVNRNEGCGCSDKMRATEHPTVPNPTIATLRITANGVTAASNDRPARGAKLESKLAAITFS